MGVKRGLILPLLVHYKFVGIVLLLMKDIGNTADVFGVCRGDGLGHDLPESVDPS